MSIILLGKTCCIICGESIDESCSYISFPAFIVNESDPIHLFSDGVCHDDCLSKHHLKKVVMERFEEWKSNTGKP